MKILIIPILVFLTCLNTGFSQSSLDISYDPFFVPLPQGDFVHVGSLKIESNKSVGDGEILLEVNGEEALESLRIIGIIPEKESILLGEASDLKGETSVEFSIKNLKEFSHLEFLVKVSKSHNLKDRVSIVPLTIRLDSDIYPIRMNRTIDSYRIATPLRNYGDDSVHSFRIPGLVTTPNGTLLAVYDIRRDSSKDLQGDIDVGLSRSIDGGKTWEPMRVIMDMGTWGGLPESENGVGDPAILVDPDTGEIWVAALWLHGKGGEMAWNSSKPGLDPDETGQFLLVKSEDDGETWSDPINITSQIKNPEWNLFFNGPGKGIVLKDGTLVFAAQYKDAKAIPHSTIVYSKDKGKTWEVGTGAKSNTTEAQVVELGDGALMLNMRDNRGGSRSIAVTNDLGKNWTEHNTSRNALPEPVCMASLINNPFKESMMLFSNPATERDRKNITIKASMDDGNSWLPDHQLLLDEGIGWGYSCLTMINEEEVGILYESSVSNITFQIIPLTDILK